VDRTGPGQRRAEQLQAAIEKHRRVLCSRPPAAFSPAAGSRMLPHGDPLGAGPTRGFAVHANGVAPVADDRRRSGPETGDGPAAQRPAVTGAGPA
jgi:hypothetical protein